LGGLAERRRAEPCAAQRAAAVEVREDWLPKLAAAHSITSYPAGLYRPVTHIPHACGEEAKSG
jgi:hypothetical protein